MQLNPNQFALPGMEDLSRLPNAAYALTKGAQFEASPGMVLDVGHGYSTRHAAAEMYWNSSNSRDDRLAPGEIGWVYKNDSNASATALYEIARTGQYGRKPRHSSDRSAAGERWATSPRVQALGGVTPKRAR